MDYPTRKAPPIPDPFKKEWVTESTKWYIENNLYVNTVLT